MPDDTQQPPVLSQPQTEKPQAEAPTPPPPTADEAARALEAERNRTGYKLRAERKHYRQQLEELEEGELSKEEQDEVARIAEQMGFDPKNEENKKQLDLIARTAAARDRIRRQKRMGILTTAARANLTKTLQELGYETGSEGFNDMGQFLFSSVGVDDPDAFSDKGFVEQRINRRIEAMTRKKAPGDQTESEILRRAGGAAPNREPRGPVGGPPGDAEKEFAERKGVSPQAAKQLKELEKQKPSWA